MGGGLSKEDTADIHLKSVEEILPKLRAAGSTVHDMHFPCLPMFSRIGLRPTRARNANSSYFGPLLLMQTTERSGIRTQDSEHGKHILASTRTLYHYATGGLAHTNYPSSKAQKEIMI